MTLRICKIEGLRKRGGGGNFGIKASDWEILDYNLSTKYKGDEHAWGFTTSHLQLMPQPKGPYFCNKFLCFVWVKNVALSHTLSTPQTFMVVVSLGII